MVLALFTQILFRRISTIKFSYCKWKCHQGFNGMKRKEYYSKGSSLLQDIFPLGCKFLAGRDFRDHSQLSILPIGKWRLAQLLISGVEIWNDQIPPNPSVVHCVAQHRVHHWSLGVCSLRHKGNQEQISSHCWEPVEEWAQSQEKSLFFGIVVPSGVLRFTPADGGRTC